MTVQPPSPHSPGSGSDIFLDKLIEFFRLLSDRTRLNILLMLRDGEKNVTTLCERLRLPQPTVSHHLGLLRTSNLIDNRRAGKQVFYGLSRRFTEITNGSLHFTCETFSIRLDPAAGGAAMPAEALGGALPSPMLPPNAPE